MREHFEDFENGFGKDLSGNDPLFVVLIGLPASGKSTFRAKYGEGFIHVSSDDTIEQIAVEQGKTYNDVFVEAVKTASLVMHSKRDYAVNLGLDILWDQTNLSEAKRQKILSQIPKNYIKIAVYFEIDEKLRRVRLGNRSGKTIPDHVDAGMILSYTQPQYSEGFDYVLDGLVDFD